MRVTRLSLFVWFALAAAHPAFAAKSPVPAMPLGSPGDWIAPNDYPATALRYDMTGTTVFRLTVDATGKPSRCDIVESSGFDVLDTATCKRLMASARFSPARNRAGKPIEDSYSNRVRWVLPRGSELPVNERFASFIVSIDDKGNVGSCRAVLHVPAAMTAPDANFCGQVQTNLPPELGLELRGDFQGLLAEVEVQLADVFTPALRARVLSPMPGYEQRGLNIHRFTATSDGKLGECSYEEQRGDSRLVTGFCFEAREMSFDPPFSALDKEGIARGWHIVRILLKIGQ